MSMIQLQPNTRFNFKGHRGAIRYAATDVVLLGFENREPMMVRPEQLQTWFANGDMTLLAREKAVVLTTFANDKEASKYEFLKYCVDKMDLHLTPKARSFVKQLLNEAALKFGWPDDKPLSDSTMIAMYTKWKDAKRDYSCLIKKAKIVRRKKEDTFKYELAQQVFDKHYLRFNGPSVAEVYRTYLEEFKREELLAKKLDQALDEAHLGKPLSETAFYDFVNSFDSFEVTKARKGFKAARREFRSRSNQNVVCFPLERVEVDALHLQIGLKVIDEITGEEKIYKPIIYIALDVFTRLVVGYHISVSEKASETANAVVQLIKHMVNPYKTSTSAKNKWPLSGAPETIFSDVGSAFTATWVRSMLVTIGCEHHMCEAASPWKKPFVESFNRTIKSQFATQMRGYVGNRNRGEVLESTIQELAVLTKDEFIAEFERYILDHYHENSHRGLGNRSPLEVWEKYQHLGMPISPDAYEKIKAYAGIDRELILRTKGIEINNLVYCSKALRKHYHNLVASNSLGKRNPKVTVLVNNDDVSKIGVLDDFTNEIIPVPCTNPSIAEGTSLHEYQATRKTRKAGNSKPFTSNVGADRQPKKSKSNSEPKNYHSIEERLDDKDLMGLMNAGNGIGAKDFGHITQKEVDEADSSQTSIIGTPLEQY